MFKMYMGISSAMRVGSYGFSMDGLLLGMCLVNVNYLSIAIMITRISYQSYQSLIN